MSLCVHVCSVAIEAVVHCVITADMLSLCMCLTVRLTAARARSVSAVVTMLCSMMSAPVHQYSCLFDASPSDLHRVQSLHLVNMLYDGW